MLLLATAATLLQWMFICALTAGVFLLKHALQAAQVRVELLRQRTDAMEEHGNSLPSLEEISRDMQKDIEAYHGDEQDMRRRMRCHFEMAMKTKEGETVSKRMQSWELFWSLVCSEVCLKICTHIAKSRLLAMRSQKPVEPDIVLKEKKTLQTLKMPFCLHWSPFGTGWREEQSRVSDMIAVHILKCRIQESKEDIVETALLVNSQDEFDSAFRGMPPLVEVMLEMHVSSYSIHQACREVRKRGRTEESTS